MTQEQVTNPMPKVLLKDGWEVYLNTGLSREAQDKLDEEFVGDDAKGGSLTLLSTAGMVFGLVGWFFTAATQENPAIPSAIVTMLLAITIICGLTFIVSGVFLIRLESRESKLRSAWYDDRRAYVRGQLKSGGLIRLSNGLDQKVVERIEQTRVQMIRNLNQLGRKGSSEGYDELSSAVQSLVEVLKAPDPNPKHEEFLMYRGKDKNIKLLGQKYREDEKRKEALADAAEVAMINLKEKEMSLRAEIDVNASKGNQ